MNTVWRFTTVPFLQNILGQVENTIDFRWLMNDRRILIANLAKGRLGDDDRPVHSA